MPLQCPTQEPFGRREIALFAEPELDRISIAVDRSVKIQWGGRPSGSA